MSMSRTPILAVDFDGTIVEHKFPEIGETLKGAFPTLKALKANGVRIMLWTMRGHPDLSKFPHTNHWTGEKITRDTLQEALDFCKENGLEFDGVNESPEQFSTSNKQYAHLYIDDAALGCPLDPNRFADWGAIAHMLWMAGWLSHAQYWLIQGSLNPGYYGHYPGDPRELDNPELPYVPYFK